MYKKTSDLKCPTSFKRFSLIKPCAFLSLNYVRSLSIKVDFKPTFSICSFINSLNKKVKTLIIKAVRKQMSYPLMIHYLT